MTSPTTVVIAGHVCVDEIQTDRSVHRTAGSPAVFMAPVLTEAGCTPLVSAPHGRDFAALGTGLRMLEPAVGDRTLVYRNDVRRTQRMQSVREADTAFVTAPGRDSGTADALGDAAALLFTPLLPSPWAGAVDAFTAAVPSDALRLLLVQGYLREPGAPGADGLRPVLPRDFVEAGDVLPRFDVAVLSEEDLPGVAHARAHAWSRAHPSTAIVVTRGPLGASVHLRGERIDVSTGEAGPLEPAALVGAGDVFGAELACALIASPGRAAERAVIVDAVERADRATSRRLAARIVQRRAGPAGRDAAREAAQVGETPIA
ncbi:hypothetical protein N1031_15535 [Herbiconiux moechotypicola]|uniref:Carbohydrate kinase PfkB domain-containing protein n=1 Tax=Herbiconiux moechotypicola TaxID=637393 RepID=A0ABN3DZB3_9MICO|nr:hypothetical protein [Herbiconiux moechotypicola]MCS5731177.1 hypothetical protein [Herbiconiux moechotypicola]